MNYADFPANPPHKAGYVLEFNDEFTSPSIDTTKWVPYYLPHWSSRERSRPRFAHDGREFALLIEADQPPWCPEFDGDVKCSSIQTGLFAGPVGSSHGQHRFKPGVIVREAQPEQRLYTPRYGYFEARIRAVASPSTLVALWLIGFEDVPENCGEITIFEVFGDQISETGSEVRYGVKSIHDTRLTGEFFHEVLPFDATKFHIYAAEWTPTHIDFYVDNLKRRTIHQSPDYPMQFMLNIYELPGEPSPPAAYPKRFVIDYVRGYHPLGGYRADR